jgi:hypothetical protein
MNKYLFSICRILVPKLLRTIFLKKTLRRKILKYFDLLPADELYDEQNEVLRFLRNNPVRIFPYQFHDNYSAENVEVIYDPENGMRYVIQDGNRLYFKILWSEKRIKRAYSDLFREQYLNSPHRYLSKAFTIGTDDVIADTGASEGNFSLSVMEKIRKVYLFKYDQEWIETLKATFSPWSEKVEIINKYVSDGDDESHIRFDTFYKNKKDVTFLKIDVDGAESIVLNSCRELFQSGNPLKLALCTYHKNNDEKEFTRLH